MGRLSDFTGASRIPFIGRQPLVEDALKRIKKGGAHVIFYEGAGGFGKTMLIEHILQRCREDLRQTLTAEEIVDFYHLDVHTPEGLIRRIIGVFSPEWFGKSRKQAEAIDKARERGEAADVLKQTENLLQVFADEFRRLSDPPQGSPLLPRCIVLAMDTLELLEHERDEFQRKVMPVSLPLLDVEKWLFEQFIPNLSGNVVLLLSARPSNVDDRIKKQLTTRRSAAHIQFFQQLLSGFNQEETRLYLSGVADEEERQGNSDSAKLLRRFVQERLEIAHFLTDGKPIRLAILADLVGHNWRYPSAFNLSLQEAQQLNLQDVLPDMEKSLVIRIQESPSPVGETLRELGWFRRGATAKLLSYTMGAGHDEDIRAMEDNLNQVRQLTLVKTRPGDQRVFLHDEMYRLLEEYVFSEVEEKEKRRVSEGARRYYQETIEAIEERVRRSPGTSVLLRNDLNQAFLEEMAFLLRHHPPLGFARYFWLAEDALGKRDAEFDAQLRAELLMALADLKKNPQAALLVEEIDLDIAARWGIRILFFQNDVDQALKVLDAVQSWRRIETEKIGLSKALLYLYGAIVLIRRAHEGDWNTAQRLLEQADGIMAELQCRLPGEEQLSSMRYEERDKYEGLALRLKVMRGACLNYQGYLARRDGRFHEAVHCYQQSILWQRQSNSRALASALTNLAYALALTGRFDHALMVAREAEGRARHGGGYHALAAALNARALVELLHSHPLTAYRHATQSLEIAKEIESPRLRGLAHLSRARASRYMWKLLSADRKRAEHPAYWDKVLEEDADPAVQLLRSDPADRIEALAVGRGPVYREAAREYYDQKLLDDPNARDYAVHRARAEEFARKSEADFLEADRLAEESGWPSYRTLAYANLAWLYYYTKQKEKIEKTLDKVYQITPQEYLFSEHSPEPPIARGSGRLKARLPLWNNLGKAEMLRAYMAWDERDFEKAAEHITLSLAYDELSIGKEASITRGEQGLHKRMMGLKPEEMAELYRHAWAFAKKRGLVQPTRFQRFLSSLYGEAELWM